VLYNARMIHSLWPALVAAAALSNAGEAPPLRSVGFLVLPGVYDTELAAPYDVLQHLQSHVDGAPRVFTVAPSTGTIETFEGLKLSPTYTLENAPEIDLLVVPSARDNMDGDLRDERLISWVRRRGHQARLLLSLCDGAFVLAKAGLLDGLEATTFPGDQDRFERTFPAVALKRDVLFVHDGKAVTSVGGARSYEAALYVVERLYGKKAADGIARGLVIDWNLSALPHRLAPGARLVNR
jgi:transcriptional regulator GlxA family with amidase domain